MPRSSLNVRSGSPRKDSQLKLVTTMYAESLMRTLECVSPSHVNLNRFGYARLRLRNAEKTGPWRVWHQGPSRCPNSGGALRASDLRPNLVSNLRPSPIRCLSCEKSAAARGFYYVVPMATTLAATLNRSQLAIRFVKTRAARGGNPPASLAPLEAVAGKRLESCR